MQPNFIKVDSGFINLNNIDHIALEIIPDIKTKACVRYNNELIEIKYFGYNNIYYDLSGRTLASENHNNELFTKLETLPCLYIKEGKYSIFITFTIGNKSYSLTLEELPVYYDEKQKIQVDYDVSELYKKHEPELLKYVTNNKLF